MAQLERIRAAVKWKWGLKMKIKSESSEKKPQKVHGSWRINRPNILRN